MRKSLAALAFAVVILIGSSAFAGTIPITNSDFSAVSANGCGGGYVYQAAGYGSCLNDPFPKQDLNNTSGIGWTFAGGAGLTVAGSAFSPPQFPNGITQVAFLQGPGSSVSQTLSGFIAGQTYDLSFYLGSRTISGMGDQTVQVLINSIVIGTYGLATGTPFTLEDLNFTYTGTTGPATLEFRGINSGDQTAFVSGVNIGYTTPEPVTLVLFGTGLAGIGGMVRRRLTK